MLKNKETLLENIAFMGIVSAINVLLSALGTYFPIIGIFIMILLPFFSAVVAIVCKWKYYIIYALASIGVALAATLWNTEYTIFYLIPSIITGFLFGICFRYHLSGTYAILFTSIAQLAITYAILPLIELIYGTNLIYVFLDLFNLLNNVDYIMIIVPSFIYLISLAQMIFSYIAITNEIQKFVPNNEKESDRAIKYIGLGFSILVVPFAFFALNISYLSMFIALYLALSILVDAVINKNKPMIITYSIMLAVGLFLPFALYEVIDKTYTFLLINSANILIFSSCLLYNQIKKNI